MRKVKTLLLMFMLFAATGCFGAESALKPVSVSKEEQAKWVRWVIPLPKQISIEQKIELSVAEIRVRLSNNIGDVERNAASKLAQLLHTKDSSDETAIFEILVGVCDAQGKVDGVAVPGAEKLINVSNVEQAYVICPVGSNKLVVTSLNERGVYYGIETLQSLLKCGLKGTSISVPMAKVIDWPDIAERGRWGGVFNGLIINNINDDIEWMSSLKMNLIESHVSYKIEQSGGLSLIDANSVERARLNAVKYVAIIPHPDLWSTLTNIYTVYPEIRGSGKAAVSGDRVAPCCSNPKLVEVLSEWMSTLAKTNGVTRICCWLSEHTVQCECPFCSKGNQYVNETKAYIEAWKAARKQYPHLQLNILLSQSTYPVNDKILAIIPADVGVTYYHGTYTYDSSRDEMIYPQLEAYARSGKWLGCYPQINASWRILCPWSGPQFVKARSAEFVRKGLACVAWYAPANNRLYDFNINAAAEWCWNSNGRDEHEFAAAWATRNTFKYPELIADWAVLLGQVSWNVYGSRVPMSFCYEQVQEMLKNNQAGQLGKDMFRYWTSIEDFDRDIAVTEKALAMARKTEVQELVDETLVVEGYLKMLKEIYFLTNQLACKRYETRMERDEMVKSLERLSLACVQTTQSLGSWVKIKGAGPGIGQGRFNDTVLFTEKTVISLGEALASHGIENNVKSFISGEAATWTTTDRDETMNKR